MRGEENEKREAIREGALKIEREKNRGGKDITERKRREETLDRKRREKKH